MSHAPNLVPPTILETSELANFLALGHLKEDQELEDSQGWKVSRVGTKDWVSWKGWISQSEQCIAGQD